MSEISDSPDHGAEIAKLKAKMIQRDFFVMFRDMVDPSKLKLAMLEHYQWIIDLEKKSLVMASGPLFKKDGGPGVGMTVFRTRDFETAEAIAASDPFVVHGAVNFRIERWQINEGRFSVSVDFSDQTYRFE